jgi:hypothetical protein
MNGGAFDALSWVTEHFGDGLLAAAAGLLFSTFISCMKKKAPRGMAQVLLGGHSRAITLAICTIPASFQ